MNLHVNEVLNKTRIYVALMRNNTKRHAHLKKCNIEKYIRFALDVQLCNASSPDILRYLLGVYYIVSHLNMGDVRIGGKHVTTRSKQNILLSHSNGAPAEQQVGNCIGAICVNVDVRNVIDDPVIYQNDTHFNILLHFLIKYKMGTRYLRKRNLQYKVVNNVLKHYNAEYSGYVIRLPIPLKQYLFGYLYKILKGGGSAIADDDAKFIINNLFDYVKPSKEHVRMLIEDLYKKDEATYPLEFVLTNLNKWHHLKERCRKMLYDDLTKHQNIYHALNINIRVGNHLYYEFVNVDIEMFYDYITSAFPINIAYYLECIAYFRFANKIHFYEYFYIIHRYIEQYIKNNSVDLEWHYYISQEQCAYNLIIKLAQYYNIYVAGKECPPIALTYEITNHTEDLDIV